jgi:hypothetical protein
VSIIDAVEKIPGYLVRWRTKGGFFRILAFAVGLIETLRLALPQAHILYPLEFALAAGWLIFWSFGSGRVPFPQRGRIVAIGIDVDPEVERNWARLLKRLSREVGGLRLQTPITLRRIDAALVNDAPAAHAYVQRFGLEQLVWGSAEAGQRDSQRIHRFKLHYTQHFPKPVNVEAVASDAALLIRGRRWTIAEINDLVDIDVLAEDFLEVAIGMIGINAFVQEHFEDATELFGRVVRGMTRRNGERDGHKLSRFRDIYQTAAVRVALDAHTSGQHEKTVSLIESLMPDLEKNIQVLLTLARAYYYTGNVKKAVHYTYRIRDLDPTEPAIFVNLAFSRSRANSMDVLSSTTIDYCPPVATAFR